MTYLNHNTSYSLIQTDLSFSIPDCNYMGNVHINISF